MNPVVPALAARTMVMGIVNVTPDSFSDGGRWDTPDAAIAHGRDLLADGADLLDIGGESTRPGAVRPSLDEELARVVPVVRTLAAEGAVISVDTMRAEVARASAEAGAAIINDVSGGLADEAMIRTVAGLDVDFICMHWRGFLGAGDTNAGYTDVVGEVLAELVERLDACLAGGIAPERLISDCGIGFSKTAEQNWELLRHLDRFEALGYRQLVGVSRKRFLGELLDGRPAGERDSATQAITALCAQQGIWAVRTHEVRGNADVVRVFEHLQRS
ncbi:MULTISPECIES: dihydropteroate synthase [unclassified Luteococcus]|uniref:dihydropteroate synthase n=1 Tax=unclassified Luteococcus TaxID=2639923 RepID=UPI00313E36AE